MVKHFGSLEASAVCSLLWSPSFPFFLQPRKLLKRSRFPIPVSHQVQTQQTHSFSLGTHRVQICPMVISPSSLKPLPSIPAGPRAARLSRCSQGAGSLCPGAPVVSLPAGAHWVGSLLQPQGSRSLGKGSSRPRPREPCAAGMPG